MDDLRISSCNVWFLDLLDRLSQQARELISNGDETLLPITSFNQVGTMRSITPFEDCSFLLAMYSSIGQVAFTSHDGKSQFYTSVVECNATKLGLTYQQLNEPNKES